MSDHGGQGRGEKDQMQSYLMAWGVTPSLGELSYFESHVGSFILQDGESNKDYSGIFT